MGSLYRSEEMGLYQLFLHTDSAYMCIAELGELGLVQFRDSVPETSAFQRKFVTEVRRCDEMERKLRYLESEIKKDGIPMLDLGDNPEAPAPKEIIDLEVNFEKIVSELQEVNVNTEALKKNYLELLELHHLLIKAQMFFDEEGAVTSGGISGFAVGPGGGSGRGMASRPLAGDVSIPMDELSIAPKDSSLKYGERDQRIQFIAGVIDRKHVNSFELMLWRACHGNVFLKRTDLDVALDDPKSGDQVNKAIFIAFFQGDQLRTRVKKISEAFHANLYPCPDSREERAEMLNGVTVRIDDLRTILNTAEEHRQRVLVEAAKSLREWFIRVRKIKAIYHVLNLFNLDVTSRAMIGECWCPRDDLEAIHGALHRGMLRSRSTDIPILNRMPNLPPEGPPTFHRTNRFTSAFQSIVDAYGVAKYQEVNPAPFTVITFPFLFAVMFGDVGHGLIMFLFALWMVYRERYLLSLKIRDEMMTIIFGGRYIILLMGAFSIYTGFIYNDIFSKSMNIFGTSWQPNYSEETLHNNAMLQLNPDPTSNQTMIKLGSVYPMGVDPIWQLAKNKITFSNSIKMKLSIVFGVLHMLFGVILSLSNHLYFQDNMSIYCEFIPQVLFLLSIFGYLVVLFFIKWLTFNAANSHCAPSLLIALINLFKGGSNGQAIPGCTGVTIHKGEEVVQRILLIIALTCVPWMLITKPLLLWHRNRHGYRHMSNVEEGRPDGEEQNQSNAVVVEQHAFEPTDVMVHQCIHTIEYCLGCISNTASYLRLWALSLAHGQLSEVLWMQVFYRGLNTSGFSGSVVITLTFAFWACLTVVILVCMEGMSAFLHALRLHWVEFQNKFYAGSGYLFVPFTFVTYTDIARGAE